MLTARHDRYRMEFYRTKTASKPFWTIGNVEVGYEVVQLLLLLGRHVLVIDQTPAEQKGGSDA
jgi:hypothetical protein